MNITINPKYLDLLHKQIIKEKLEDERIIRSIDGNGNFLIGEAEAMYFKAIRNFVGNSISHRIMERNQDIYEDEFNLQNKRR